MKTLLCVHCTSARRNSPIFRNWPPKNIPDQQKCVLNHSTLMYSTYYSRVEWFFIFLIGQKTALNRRSGMILKVQIQNFVAHGAFKFTFLKISRRPNNNKYFCVKIVVKLPFTIKNTCKKTFEIGKKNFFVLQLYRQ